MRDRKWVTALFVRVGQVMHAPQPQVDSLCQLIGTQARKETIVTQIPVNEKTNIGKKDKIE